MLLFFPKNIYVVTEYSEISLQIFVKTQIGENDFTEISVYPLRFRMCSPPQ